MKIDYKTQASASEILKGVNVSLSAEYDKDTKPVNVTCYCEGTLSEEGNPYVNISGTYDCVNGVFSSINGASLTSGFLPQLETRIMEFSKLIGN